MKQSILAIVIFFTISAVYGQENWQGFGLGINGAGIRSFYEDTINNRLIVGGAFTSIDTFQNYGLAVWDGVKWDCFSEGLTSNGMQIFSIIEYLDTLYIGGSFWKDWNGDTIHDLAKWDGNIWIKCLDKFDGYIRNMRIINNELYIIGTFDTINGISTNGLAKYNGVSWSNVYDLPNFSGQVSNPNLLSDIAFYNDELYVGGNFFSQDNTISDIIKFNGTDWVSPIEGGIKGSYSSIERMCIYDDKLIIAGTIYKSEGNVGNFIQAYDGNEWSELGGGVYGLNMNPYSNAQIKEMQIYNNKLYITGVFAYAGGVPIQSLAIWDGEKWCGLGSDFGLIASAFGFYRDTLYLNCGDYIDGIQVNGIARWIGGDYIDTCSTTKIEEYDIIKNSISIFPNPATENINVILTNNNEFVEIDVFNTIGENIYSAKCQSDKIIINTMNFKSGMYFIKLSFDKKVVVKKVIINK